MDTPQFHHGALPRQSSEPPDPGEVQRLRQELLAAKTSLVSVEASLRLQGLRGDGLQASLDASRHQFWQLQRSVSWRLTVPLRIVRALVAGRLPTGHGFGEAASRIVAIARDDGVAGLLAHGRRFLPTLPRPALCSRQAAKAVAAAAGEAAPGTPEAATDPARAADPYRAAVPAGTAGLSPQILIVAELSVPQCAKYRVWQKQEMFAQLGWKCAVLNWRDIDHVATALQLCTQVIFYRVPGEAPLLALIEEAKRVGLQPWWEVDDLIFDEPLYLQNSNLASLQPGLRRQVLKGIGLYRSAMLACGRTIASTEALAAEMQEVGIAETCVIENALDGETIAVAAALRRSRATQPAGGDPMIVFGSGTKTHDADFLCAAPAILALLQRHPTLRLRIVGDLILPDAFAAFAVRVEHLPATGYRSYLQLLSEATIAIAPLEPSRFNDAKSNIKFQEAAILGIASVCSPRASFRSVVVPDRNGLLAESAAEWEQALERLIIDPVFRQRLGEQALQDVQARYAPDRVAREQLVRLAGRPVPPPRAGMRVLTANIFFPPRSFGGATIVAQEMATRLAAADDVELCVFTSRPSLEGRPASLLRYAWNGMKVLAHDLATQSDQVVQLDNPSMAETFGQVLDAVRPDVVHVHSIQGFGAAILRQCQARAIPYIITLHDAWWLCDRQFMVRADNRYCFQEQIDLRVCQACLPGARHLDERMQIMKAALAGAALLLSPSESHRQLYIANGVPADRIRVHRNGVRMPQLPRTPRVPGSRVRFGFLAGAAAIKGFHLIRSVFESLAVPDWELVLVDNTLNLGFRSIDVSDWRVQGRIRVVPAYTQDGLDALFDSLDVLLFPSQWKESFGLSVREALLRHVWVIATAGGGQAEEIVDGVNGRLIPLDGTARGLLAAVSEILAAPEAIDAYRNPYQGGVATYERQAAELLTMLREVSVNRTSLPLLHDDPA